jgi:hypothetical protein
VVSGLLFIIFNYPTNGLMAGAIGHMSAYAVAPAERRRKSLNGREYRHLVWEEIMNVS